MTYTIKYTRNTQQYTVTTSSVNRTLYGYNGLLVDQTSYLNNIDLITDSNDTVVFEDTDTVDTCS